MIATPGLPYWRLSGFYFCYFALLGATAPFLSLYFHHLGFSSPRIGELVAIPMLMRCMAPSLWGWLGDRSGKRLLIVRLGALFTAITFCGIFFSHRYVWLALVMAGHAFFWHAVLPQFEVITLTHLRERRELYSRIRLWGSIGFICAVAGLGKAFEWWSLDVYPLVLLGIMSGIFLCSCCIPDTATQARRSPANGTGFLAQLMTPGMLAFFACAGLMQLSHGPYYTFLTLHLESLGYTRGTIGQLWALGVVAEVLLFLVMPVLLRHFSLSRILWVSCLLAAVRWSLMGSFAEYPLVLILIQLLHAATFGSFHVAAISFVQSGFGAHQQGQGQALYASLSGIGGALGALYSGYTWNTLGPTWTFFLAAMAALLAMSMVVSGRKHEAIT